MHARLFLGLLVAALLRSQRAGASPSLAVCSGGSPSSFSAIPAIDEDESDAALTAVWSPAFDRPVPARQRDCRHDPSCLSPAAMAEMLQADSPVLLRGAGMGREFDPLRQWADLPYVEERLPDGEPHVLLFHTPFPHPI